MNLDVPALVEDIINALKHNVGANWQAISQFAQSQTTLLAKQGKLIAESRATGALHDDDELFYFFVDQLAENTKNFTRSMAALTAITLESAWNTVVTKLWNAINTIITHAGLPGLIIPPLPVP
jgi:uncharacterized protein YecA (UPF0149 family)